MKQKLLFLSAHMPSLNATEAGHVCAFRHLDVLTRKYEVHFVGFRGDISADWNVEPLLERCASVKLFKVDIPRRMAWILRNPFLPMTVAARASHECRAYIRKLMSIHSFDRVHFEWHHMASYADLFDGVEFTTYAHDIYHQTSFRKSQTENWLKRLFYKIEFLRLKTWEARAFGCMDRIFIPSEKDMELLENLDSSLKEHCRISRLSFKIYSPRSTKFDGTPILGFWGAYSRMENVDAARTLVHTVLPAIEAQGAVVKVKIAGAHPPASFGQFPKEKVEVTGFVDDPGEVLRSLHLAVLPLQFGGGVKIKVLECLSAGVPVVTTPVGAEGIPCSAEQGLIVGGTTDELARAVVDLLRQPERIASLSLAAASWARSYADTDGAVLL